MSGERDTHHDSGDPEEELLHLYSVGLSDEEIERLLAKKRVLSSSAYPSRNMPPQYREFLHWLVGQNRLHEGIPTIDFRESEPTITFLSLQTALVNRIKLLARRALRKE